MSCPYPFQIKTENYNYFTNSYYHYIPCGWCLNCRVDKQNELTHRCEYELIQKKSGAFVTLTYDDLHIIPNLRKDANGKLCATVSKSDLQHYLYRLRSNIKNHLPDNFLSDHHFKYLAVSEYGSDGQIFDRPHIHILFFGLDFAVCKKELQRAWQGRGMIKVLPILNGGIRYVLKYLDKQLHSDLAKQKYDNNNIDRPFQTHSLGLGSKLYENQLSYINNHNGCYRWKGHDVPVPAYYKNKLLTKDYSNCQKYIKAVNKYTDEVGHRPKSRYDLHNFNIKKNLLKEKNLNHFNRLNGKPIYSRMHLYDLKKTSQKYIYQLENQAALSQIPF